MRRARIGSSTRFRRIFAYVGLIHLAVPHSRIIHARLRNWDRYYRSYERLMRHWKEILPEGVMLEVRDEDVWLPC